MAETFYIGNTEVFDVSFGDVPVNEIYKGDILLWEKKKTAAMILKYQSGTDTVGMGFDLIARRQAVDVEENYDDPLCFTAQQNNSTIKLNENRIIGDFKISFDRGSWQNYTVGDTITLKNVGDKVYFSARSQNETIFGGGSSGQGSVIMTGKIAASGNIQYLLDSTGERKDVPDNCYWGMFEKCTALTQAPELPATIFGIGGNHYSRMFWGCTSLTTAPALPATTLGDYCYSYMFRGCTSLTQAPELPATTLTNQCYYQMFLDCTSLTTAPKLPATTLADDCYQYMFYGCSSLNSLSVTGNIEWGTDMTTGWLANVSQTGRFTAPHDILISLEQHTRGADTVPAEWLATEVPEDCLCFTAEEVGSSGVTISLQNVAGEYKYSDGTIFNDYTLGTPITLANVSDKVYFSARSQNETCYLNDTTSKFIIEGGRVAASGNIQYLLDSTGERRDAPEQCYQYMFFHCTSLTQTPELPATTLAIGCYKSMFEGCFYLTTAPVLPASTLAQGCYESMFYNCYSLSTLKITGNLDWPFGSQSYTNNWLKNVSETGTFYASQTILDDLATKTRGSDTVPVRWSTEAI